MHRFASFPFRSSRPSILRIVHRILVGLVIIFIAIPVVVTAVMSFNDAPVIRFPIQTYSSRWYFDFFARSQWWGALLNSLQIATCVMAISLTGGTLAAYAQSRTKFFGKQAIYFLLLLPLFMPGVVLGLGLAMAFGGVEVLGAYIYGGKSLVVAAHCLWSMPLTFMVMVATFDTLDMRLVEASYDLGGGPLRTFSEVTLPMVSTGLLSSALFSFVISLNEFVMALFLTTRDTQTLPVLMWLSLRSAGTPLLAVASIILASAVFISLFVVMLWYTRQLRRFA